MPRYTIDQKLDIVANWKRSGIGQDAFLRAHNINVSSRSLRSWVALVRRPEDALARLREVVAQAMDEWTAIRAAMDGEALGPRTPDDDVADDLDDANEASGRAVEVVPHEHGVPEPAPPPAVAARMPMPPSSWRPW